VGAALAIVWVISLRTREKPCPGAVTLEFHPPLTERGRYRIELGWEGAPPCRFQVDLPLTGMANGRDKSGCGMAMELKTQVQGGQVSLAGLTFAAAPSHLRLQVKRDAELIYDTPLEPRFAPYATTRVEDKHFCGDRALVLPRCLRGSSACVPFATRCTGPKDCGSTQVCCLTPEWGRDFGPLAASECTSERRCLAHLGRVGCQVDSDCLPGMQCSDSSLAAEFSTPVLVCRNH